MTDKPLEDSFHRDPVERGLEKISELESKLYNARVSIRDLERERQKSYDEVHGVLKARTQYDEKINDLGKILADEEKSERITRAYLKLKGYSIKPDLMKKLVDANAINGELLLDEETGEHVNVGIIYSPAPVLDLTEKEISEAGNFLKQNSQNETPLKKYFNLVLDFAKDVVYGRKRKK